ncbi:MAG TPA: hypothetical protein DCM02_05555 [Flavobacterium sp.]|nr:hypothetical protein [Flavobacterium sp.]
MNKEAFEALLIIKLQDLLSLIKEKKSSFRESLHWLYNSRVYDGLKNEELKMWQMSTHLLYEMLENEKDDNTH